MQAIMETGFDIVYLVTVLTLGIRMLRECGGRAQFRLFGAMAVVLGAGDAFHLVPRAVALCTTGLENYTVALGAGKWITSITMTVFYVLLYYVWRLRYAVSGRRGLTALVWVLAALLIWGIWRNLPFAALGIVIILLFYRSARDHGDKAFRWMWLTIVLSFAFYIPVVLWADAVPMIGMLMIPKTCAYVWTVVIGWRAMKAEA